MPVIYFLQRSNGDVKIGTTANFRARLSQLISKHGDLTLLGLMIGSYEVEQALHKQFEDQRRGATEFFRMSDDLLQYIHEHAQLDLSLAAQDAQQNNSDKLIQLRVPADAYEVLKAAAEAERRTVSEFIRIAVEDRLKAPPHEQLVNLSMQRGGWRGGRKAEA